MVDAPVEAAPQYGVLQQFCFVHGWNQQIKSHVHGTSVKKRSQGIKHTGVVKAMEVIEHCPTFISLNDLKI